MTEPRIVRLGLRTAVALALCLAGGTVRAEPDRGRGRDAYSLEGVWTLGTYTPFERAAGVRSLRLTAAEAEAYEAPRRALHGALPAKPGEVGQAESEFNERGEHLARVKGEIRSSWIIDPVDGRTPFTREARRRLRLDADPGSQGLDNPEEASASDRCIGNWTSGAPMIGGPDANLLKVVQTKTAIAILTEKYHDVRIVRLGPPVAGLTPSRLGNSQGRWEGRTLVVETSGFPAEAFVRGSDLAVSGATRVTERFTRVGPEALLYEFRVEDPTLYTQPWRGEMTLRPAKAALYEYACHEGNYWMRSALRAARAADARLRAPAQGR